MLISLLKVLLFILVIGVVAWAGVQLMNMPGTVAVDMFGYSFQLTVFQMALSIVALVLLIAAFIKLMEFLAALVAFLNGDENAISRYFRKGRERRGLESLKKGLMALASGEGGAALSEARKAEKFLNEPKITRLLSAQAAELAGDRKTAAGIYRELVQDEETRFVGIQGVMKHKLAAGDTDGAFKLAERAFALKPKHEGTQDVLLKLQADRGDWDGARKTLAAKLKSGNMPRDLHRRRDAILAYSRSAEVGADGRINVPREDALEANRLSPDFIPGAAAAARAYIATGEKRNAAKVLKKTWETRPHPDLAAVFAEIEPEESPEARIKRFEALVRVNSDDAESKMLMAELHIAAEDFPGARRALGSLITDDPTARVLTIMAAIERGEGADDQVVRGWLTKALTAPRGPQWICDNCHTIYDRWLPVCDACGGFDTVSWRRPKNSEVAMPASTEMLPLITDPVEAAPEDAELIEDIPSNGAD